MGEQGGEEEGSDEDRSKLSKVRLDSSPLHHSASLGMHVTREPPPPISLHIEGRGFGRRSRNDDEEDDNDLESESVVSVKSQKSASGARGARPVVMQVIHTCILYVYYEYNICM